MILIVNKINFSTIIYITVQKLLSFLKGKDLNIYSIDKNKYIQKLFRIHLLDWKIIEINENNLNKLIEINYIKTNKIIEELFNEINLNQYLLNNKYDPRLSIYIKKALYSDNIPGLNFNIKKLLIILDVLKYKFKNQQVHFIINNFTYINFFKKKYISDKIYIKSLINFKLIKYNLINFFLIFFTNLFSKYLSKFFRKKNTEANIKFSKIIIDTPFENIDENEYFMDNNFIYTSYLHPINNKSRYIFENKNLNYKSINIVSDKKNIFKKNHKYFFIKTLLNFKKLRFDFPDNYINKLLILYFIEKKIWLDFFILNNSRVYYTNYKWSKHVEPASSAIDILKGISLLSYHSFYEYVSYSSIVSTDILLSFNDNFDNIEKKAGSIYKVNLPVGYPKTIIKNFDKKVNEIKSFFFNKNIEKIILFLDQGNTSDEKFDLGLSESSKGFSIMFDLLIRFPNIGLIIKPKKPKFIFDKINKIANFNQALLTKRLYIEENYSEGNSKNLKMSPYIPASVSDIVVHDHLVAATAGIDAHISCDRVIYFDHYQFKENSIFNTFDNKDDIIFNDWPVLIENIENFINGNNPKLGLWDKNDFNTITINNNSYNNIKRILNKINTDLLNNKQKDTILETIKNQK